MIAGGLALAACTDGGTDPVGTGPLGAANDAGSVGVDAPGTTPPDAASGAVCTGSPVDVGPPSGIAVNSPRYFSTGRFFVVRDSGGVYALSGACTHEGVACTVSGGNFRCPRHGAKFTFNGAIISGPVNKVLVHYSVCLLPSGNLGVITSSIVPATTRLMA